MPIPRPPPVIAIAQIPMHWEIGANVQAIERALEVAQRAGASHCAFAELAVTGFHRRIAEWARPEVSGPAVERIRQRAAALGLSVALGAPTYAGAERFNSHLFLDPDGSVAGTVRKNGLTAPEATFFHAGRDRPVVALGGLRCTAVICREVEDRDALVRQLGGQGLQVVFWPGLMRPDPSKPPQDPPEHLVQAQGLARALGAYVVQTNWPNALNRPEESEHAGHSACVDPRGRLLFRLPRQGLGLGVFTLGSSRYRWHPWED